MKTKVATNGVAGAKEQPVEVSGDVLESKEAKAGVFALQKERLAGRIQSLKPLLRSRKFLISSGVLVLLLVALFAIPLTRYKVLGLFVKRDFKITIQDTTSQRMVSGATIIIDNTSFVTDKDGVAELKGIRVGEHNITITKKHYKELKAETLVTLQKDRTVGLKLEATGRQVPVTVKKKIGGAPLSDALLKAGDSDARTDKDGMAVLVIPVGSDEIKAKLSADGYNDADVTIKVTESAIPENTFGLTPVGKVYFLSKQSGRIDVVKTNLDGTDRKLVVAGTGREDEYETVLLASRDWKYLALQSRRNSDKPQLFLIETENDKMTSIDEGDVSFTLHGWSAHNFVYSVARNKVPIWEPKRFALKGFNADSKQLATLDESRAKEGSWNQDYTSEVFANVIVSEGLVTYSKSWTNCCSWYYPTHPFEGRNNVLASVEPNGKNGKTLKEFPAIDRGYIETRLYAPDELYIRYTVGSNQHYFEYENGEVKSHDISSQQFDKPYPTYLLSPSGERTLWSDERDGKNVVFVGNKNGEDEKMIASFVEFTPFGWYSDEYVLVSKKGSELYIMPRSGAQSEENVVKVSDYHKPRRSFAGYGGGYGGL